MLMMETGLKRMQKIKFTKFLNLKVGAKAAQVLASFPSKVESVGKEEKRKALGALMDIGAILGDSVDPQDLAKSIKLVAMVEATLRSFTPPQSN